MHDGVIVGVDGGATRARAVVLSREGSELVRVNGPAGIVDPNDPGAAAAVVIRLTRDALAAAGARSPAAALCCGLAGAGRDTVQEAVRVALTLADIADDVIVMSDAEAAMIDAFGDDAGVLVVAGTGSIAWARSQGGEPVRVGGWGALLDDVGSGYALGLGALRAVVRAADGRAAGTALTDVVLTHASVTSVEALIAWAAAAEKSVIAALAPAVLACADSGDAAACGLRDRAVADVVELAARAAARAALDRPRVALAGGLVEPGGPLRLAVAAGIEKAIPGAELLDYLVDAARGAARSTLRPEPPRIAS